MRLAFSYADSFALDAFFSFAVSVFAYLHVREYLYEAKLCILCIVSGIRKGKTLICCENRIIATFNCSDLLLWIPETNI